MIEIKNITKVYKLGSVDFKSLNNLSIKINTGEFLSIMGPSGSGKSTLLHIIGLLDKPDSGLYLLQGKSINNLNDKQLAFLRNKIFGFIFQQFHLLPGLSIFENVELPLIYSNEKIKNNSKIVYEKLELVGLANKSHHKPTELSGGEQQRVAIARALINDPLIILADEPTGNLDTKNKNEIMKILKNLNKMGKTIIIVTHENEIANETERIIFIRDGRIVDEKNKVPSKKEKIILNNEKKIEKQTKLLYLADYLIQSFKAILSHKLRSILSVLGILIGVASVIAMLALGEGAKESIYKQFSSLGVNLLTIRPGRFQRQGLALDPSSLIKFNLNDVSEIEKLPEVKMVCPSVLGKATVIYGNKNWNTRLEGVGVNYEKMRNATPIAGRFFTEYEVKRRAKVCLVGYTIVKFLFNNSNPVGEILKINKINFKVIGVLPIKGTTGWQDQDDRVVIPYTTAMFRVLGQDYLNFIDVSVKSEDLIEISQKKIKELILKLRKIKNDVGQELFEIRNLAEIQEAMSQTIKTVTTLLGIIASISLIVGGIGIMNIMLVSVTERTKEIGIRKAIGASNKDIMIQFLIESIILTLSGGILGITTGGIIVYAFSNLANWNVKISFFSILISTIFSFLVGLSFGLYPAYKASKLNPVEALRYE